MKFNWPRLWCVDGSADPHPTFLSDDATRVVLQGQEDYINASHITVRITDIDVTRLCVLSLSDILCELILCAVCVCASVYVGLSVS